MQHPVLPIFLASLLKICSGGDWCYQSQFICEKPACNAPENWNHANTNCAGVSQSPINIVTRKAIPDMLLTPFQFNKYQEAFTSIIQNNGHSAQVTIPHQPTVASGNLEVPYKAMQFHLHWGKDGGPGSEHTIDGEQYPMEMHIVHIKQHFSSVKEALDDPKGVAVLGYFYEESTSNNRKYEPIIKALQKIKVANSNTTLGPISLDQLIPSQQNLTNYYRYMGSLTTPSCNEAVVWTVFENPIPLSKSQLQAFAKLQFKDGKPMIESFRPVQPLNGRRVYRSGGAMVLANVALMMASVALVMGLSQPN